MELHEQTAWTDSAPRTKPSWGAGASFWRGRFSQSRIPSGSRVLDAGCGTGVLSKALAEAGATVVGIDASEAYLQGARDRRSHPSITYEHGDIFIYVLRTGLSTRSFPPWFWTFFRTPRQRSSRCSGSRVPAAWSPPG